MKKREYQTPCTVTIHMAAVQIMAGSDLLTTLAGNDDVPEGGWEEAQSRLFDELPEDDDFDF